MLSASRIFLEKHARKMPLLLGLFDSFSSCA